MKFIIIGLGNFGSSLALQLTNLGHEIIGVDFNMKKAEMLQEKIMHTICMDTTDENAIDTLPITDADYVVIAIGEDTGASILSTALIKQRNPKRIIGRAINPLHQTVLQSMGIEEIVHPEEETAERWANKFDVLGTVDSFNLDDKHKIVEIIVPKRHTGMSIKEADFRKRYNLNVITVIQELTRKNLLGKVHKYKEVMGVLDPDYLLKEGDILVVFGTILDIEKMTHL